MTDALKGKIAQDAAASRVIGRAIALSFAATCADVVVGYP
jgi:NAD(P)-dependent dehydrogenase (short-subunit alcohol dehydrogenase family)